MPRLEGLALVVALCLALDACGTGTVGSPDPFPPKPTVGASVTQAPTASPGTSTPTADKPSDRSDAAQLPRGGQEVFPRYRLVGYAGLTGARTLGRLGTGPLDQRVSELERRAADYAGGREILPVLEVIATIAKGSPGHDRRYRIRITDKQIETYLKTARKHKAFLLLNIQPGRSEFLPEARAYERWLKLPDVGGPGSGVGDGPRASAWPSLWPQHRCRARRRGVLHRRSRRGVRPTAEGDGLPPGGHNVLRAESGLNPHPGVVAIKSVDGLGHAGRRSPYRHVEQTTRTSCTPDSSSSSPRTVATMAG